VTKFFVVYSKCLIWLLTVERVVACKSSISVEGISAGRLHVVSVVQPDIVSFLASKDSKSSTDDNCCNDDNCQQTCRDTNDLSGTQSEHTRLSVSIADLACIDLCSWDLINVASLSQSSAESNITSSLLLINSAAESCCAVGDGILASQD